MNIKNKVGAMLLLGTAMIWSAGASATTFGGGSSTSLQGIFDTIATDGTNDVNVVTDHLADNVDSYWQISASGGSVSTIVIELAGNADSNTFGVYDAITNQYVELFDGGAVAGNSITLSITLNGSVLLNFVDTNVDFNGNSFAFYLGTATQGTFYSDTSLNADGMDHMLAYQGVGEEVQIGGYAAGPWSSNEYILAWEDLAGVSDMDYDDFVVIVESVSPVPAPAGLALLGLGLLGLGAVRRNKG